MGQLITLGNKAKEGVMATTGTGLARGAIGLREVLFQSVTSMAPAGAVALSIAAGATYAGGALPLTVLLALIACLLVATSIGQLAKHLPSAGSIYTYPAEAIHPALGFLVGWGYALVEALLGPITMVLCGYLIGSITSSEFGWPFTTTWVIFMIVASFLVAALNYRGIQVSAGRNDPWPVRDPRLPRARCHAHRQGRLSEHDKRLHPALRDDQGLQGLLRHRRRLRLHHPGVHRLRGRGVWGVGWVVAFFAILNSTFANGNAGTLATTRTWYAMSRIGLLPSPLAKLHPRWSSPYVGVVVQFVLTLAIGLPIGLHFWPTTAFVFLATILTGIMIAIYMVFNLSCLLFYLRRREEFNVLLHAVIPVLGILAFIPAWLTALGIGSSFLKFVTPLSYPASETGLAIGIWYGIGIVVLVYLYLKHPERLPEMKRVFADDALPAADEPGTSGGAA